MHYRGTGRVTIYAAATAALSLGLLGGNTYAQSLANDIGSENMLGVQFVQAGPALAPNQAAGVIPQNNFNPVFINNSTGTSGTTGDLVNAFGADTGITLTHISNDGYNSNVETTTPDGILLHGEDKTGPAGRTLSNNPGLTSTYTFNNVPNGNYALVTYTENDWAGVNANLTVGATTNYITDQAVGGVPDAAPQSVPAFLSANNTNPNIRVTGNYVTFNNVTPANGQITLTNTSEGGANDTASVNGFQLVGVATVQATRTPSTPETAHPISGQLMVFDANPKDVFYGTFVTASNTPGTVGYINPNDPTVVLAHGFASSDGMWAGSGGFAESLAVQQPSTNIVAWNWADEAKYDGIPADWFPDLTSADLSSQDQGVFLAQSLVAALGSTYNSSIHFIGHSLGTMVNAKAIDMFAKADPSAGIHDTLFDDGELANYVTGTIESNLEQLQWYNPHFSSIPNDTSNITIDNYLSLVGHVHQRAVNVILQQAITNAPDLLAMHGYPVQWYQSTMGLTNTTTPELQGMGYQFNGSQAQPGIYPFNFLQVVAPGDQYALSPMTYSDATTHYGGIKTLPSELFNYLATVTIENIKGAVQIAGNAVVNIVNLPPDSLNNNTPALGPQFVLSKSGGASLSPLMISAGTVTNGTSNVSAANMSYVFVPIEIPRDAQMMTLDYVMNGLSPTDLLSIGINDTPLFALEGQFVTPASITNTGYLDVSQWAGTDVQLFIGLIPGDNQNIGGTVTVDNIEFETIPEPSSILFDLGALVLVIVSPHAFGCRRIVN